MSNASLIPDEQGPHLSRRKLRFRQLAGGYAIVRLSPNAAVPPWAGRGEFSSITRTAEELSIVCPSASLPAEIHSPERWICLKLEGPFPFSLAGVLLSFIQPLSSRGIPIFAISTYDTDHVLIPEDLGGSAVEILREAGHELVLAT